ncbi:MAG TPA: argininosuccinate lyase [Bacteroidales bacterium]|nr:argininosuccinate lyase [Bacteroidales bacterium]
MHLWDKGIKTREGVIIFTCGRDRSYDERLAEYDIAGSMAHTVMLENCGIISTEEKRQLLRGLSSLFAEAEKGQMKIGNDYEDIHSYIEFRLREFTGEAAGKLHTGRSRNDQVLTNIHLWLRDESSLLAAELYQLAVLFLGYSEKYKGHLMPGFTHMQPAMMSSFGLWFAAYAESLCDDLQMLSNAAAFAAASPLGTAAGYGTTLPINRELTASLLGFERLIITSPYAQMSRGRTERTMIQAIASAANTLGRFASEAVLFMSPGYNFLTLSEDFTTGSSIMPQKKNPDLFELLRVRCNRLQGKSNEVTLMITNLASGYNRDYQELKALLFDAFDEIREIVAVTTMASEGLILREDIMTDEKYNVIFSVEEANAMVIKGVPFRDAYRAVAEKIGSGLFKATTPSDYTHTGSIGNTGEGLIRARVEKLMKHFNGGISLQELVLKIVKEAFL